nr:ribosomal protein S5 [Tanacetum cinerariifolium]
GFDVKLIEINRTCEVTKHIKYTMMVVYGNYHDVIGFAKAKGEAIPSASQKSSALTTFGAANSSPGPGNMDRNSLIPAMVAMVDGNTKSNTMTWTVEYDKLSKDVPDPDSLLEFAKNVIKYAETRLNPTLVIEAEFAQKVGNDIKMPQLQ